MLYFKSNIIQAKVLFSRDINVSVTFIKQFNKQNTIVSYILVTILSVVSKVVPNKVVI